MEEKIRGNLKMHMQEEIEENLKLTQKKDYYRGIGSELWSMVKNKKVIITGSGTSYNASVLLNYVLMRKGLLSHTIQSSEVRYLKGLDLSNYVSILFSHSGESSDILGAAEILKSAGSKTISITDFPNSSLARLTDAHFDGGAGEEKSIAATKSHFAQTLISLSILEKGEFDHSKDVLQGVLENENIKFFAEKMGNKAVLLGTGMNYPLAMEGALKLQETSEAITYHYPEREFLHGPIQILSSEWSVIMLSTNPEIEKKVAIYDAHPIVVGNDPANEIFIDSKEEINIHLGKLMALQLLSYYHAISMGMNPDSPSKLSKVVK